MAESARAIIRLSAVDDTRAGLTSVRGSLNSLDDRAAALGRNFAMLRASFLSVFAGTAVRSIVQAADTYSNLNARLALVTKSTAEFTFAQEALFAMAQQTRTGLQQTSDLFGTLSRSTESLGVSQGAVLAVTETINKALAVSGTSAGNAAAALVQLGQGFASGVLRGEELNSVLEQAPRLARAIADGMGVPLGKLRELGKAGQLTAEQVFNALRGQGDAIAAEFDRLPLTVGGAVQQVQNSLVLLVGAAAGATDAQQALAKAASEAAGWIAEVAKEIKRGAEGADDIGLVAEAFLTWSETMRVIAANQAFIFKGIGREIGAIAAQLVALAHFDFSGFTAISDAVTEDARRARAELDKYERDVLTRMKPKAPEFGMGDFARMDRRMSATPAASTATGGSPKGGAADPYANAIKQLKQQIALLGQKTELEKIDAQIQLGNYGKLSSARANVLRQLAATLDANRELQAATEARLGVDLAKIKRDLAGVTSAFAASEAILEAQRAAGAVADRDYFNARIGFLDLTAAAQVRALQAENARLAAEQSSGAERIKNLETIADNEARIAQIRVEAAGKGQALLIQQAAELKKLTTAYAEAEAAAQNYLDTLRLQNQRDLAGMGQGTRARERNSGRTNIEDRYTAQLQQLESDKRQGLPQEQYEQELERIKRFQAQALAEWDTYFDARIAKEQDASVGLSEAAANYVSDAQDIAKQTEDLFTSSFKGMEDALVSFVTTGKLDFKSLADSIVADITRMIVKQQIMLPLMDALGLGGGSGGGKSGGGGSWLGDLVGGFFGGLRADGGPVSHGRAYLVGERGPELIVPAANGMVVPTEQLGGKSQTVNYAPTFVLQQPASRETQQQLAAAAYDGAQRAFARNG